MVQTVEFYSFCETTFALLWVVVKKILISQITFKRYSILTNSGVHIS